LSQTVGFSGSVATRIPGGQFPFISPKENRDASKPTHRGASAVVDVPDINEREGEAKFVAAARAGYDDAFGQLVRNSQARIFRLALHMTQNTQDAEDVMQETFIKAYLHLEQFRGDSRFSTWLVRIAVNEALQNRRRNRPNQVNLHDFVENDDVVAPRQLQQWNEDPERHYAKAELQRILFDALGKLAPGYRMVFLLRDVEDLSTDETSQLLGLSVPTVKSRLLRARLQLRELLTEHFKAAGNSRSGPYAAL
jgi:RNA polymerase sigma-70 factor, ECF subfamily